MKHLITGACCVLLCLCSHFSLAQTLQFRPPINEPDYNKPRLFADLPARMELKLSALEPLLDLPVGASINTKVSDKLVVTGTVVSKADHPSVTSIVVRLANRLGASLTFTRITNADGTTSFIGRMISLRHGDAFDIVQENNRLFLQKKGLYELFTE